MPDNHSWSGIPSWTVHFSTQLCSRLMLVSSLLPNVVTAILALWYFHVIEIPCVQAIHLFECIDCKGCAIDVCFINWWYQIRTITTFNGKPMSWDKFWNSFAGTITTEKLLSLRGSKASSYHFCIGTTLVDHCQISRWYCEQNDNHPWISRTTYYIRSLNIFEYRWFPRYGVLSKLMWCIALVVNRSKAIEKKHKTCSKFVNLCFFCKKFVIHFCDNL